MALLPTFLAFGNLYVFTFYDVESRLLTSTEHSRYVPRSSESFATSWLIGFGSALYTLGLPVRSVSTSSRSFSVILFPKSSRYLLQILTSKSEKCCPKRSSHRTWLLWHRAT